MSIQSEMSLTSASSILQAAQTLKAGGLVAFPTETVYGLGANAEDVKALSRLYAVKGRPTDHPVIVHVARADQLSDWAVDIPDMAYQLANAFWPGPLTLILKRSARVPDEVTGGQDTVGIRVPSHPIALALLQAFGGGVAAPSANRFGRLSPTSALHVREDLGEDVNCILDGGACQVGVESTIVAFRAGQPVILRPGMITAEQIESVLSHGEAPADSATETTAAEPASTVSRAPGTLASHYAPRTPVELLSADELALQMKQVTASGESVGLIAFQGHSVPETVIYREMPIEPQAYAQRLYAELRALDALQLSRIFVQQVPEVGAWLAVYDRLNRAAFKA